VALFAIPKCFAARLTVDSQFQNFRCATDHQIFAAQFKWHYLLRGLLNSQGLFNFRRKYCGIYWTRCLLHVRTGFSELSRKCRGVMTVTSRLVVC
jgi:hypothetical protein